MPTIGRASLGFLVLPFSTYKLDAADFGLYALATSVCGVGPALACAGSGYTLASHFSGLDGAARKSLVSSLLISSMLIGVCLSSLLLIGLLLWGDMSGLQLSSSLILLIVLMAVMPIPWTYGVQIVTLDAKPEKYAVIQLGEALIASAVTLLGLYLFSLGVEALFVGALVGATFTAAGSLWVMRSYLGFSIDASWVRSTRVVGGLSVLSLLAEKTQELVERSVVSFSIGLEQMGIYAHSQQYRNIVGMGVKSAAYSLWPVSLEEARRSEMMFQRTKASWDMVALGVTSAGIAFSIFGEFLIGMLTHGKFSSAYVLAALWMIFILLQNTGKSQIAFLYAHGHGAGNQNAITFSAVLAMLLLFFLAPIFGVAGVVASVFFQVITYRLVLIYLAKRKSTLPFLDERMLGGACVVSVSLYFSAAYPSMEWRTLNLMISILGLIFVFLRQLRSLAGPTSRLFKDHK